MGLVKGGFLRLFQTFLYALAFCCAAIVLGIYSYYLAELAEHNQHIATWKKAVEGLSGAAVLYTIFTTLLTCCLAGIAFLSILGLILDLCFVGCFIAIAVMTRHGASSCHGNVNTPLGSGLASSRALGGGSLGLACRLNTAAFAVSIVACLIFLLTAIMQLALMRHHKKEKRYGPSPDNSYTSGSGRRKFGRKNKVSDAEKGALGAGAVGAAAHHGNGTDIRPSHDTAYTGSTVAAPNANNNLKKETESVPTHHHNGEEHAPHVGYNPQGNTEANRIHDNYYTAPVGSANPYGYENTTGTARNF